MVRQCDDDDAFMICHNDTKRIEGCSNGSKAMLIYRVVFFALSSSVIVPSRYRLFCTCAVYNIAPRSACVHCRTMASSSLHYRISVIAPLSQSMSLHYCVVGPQTETWMVRWYDSELRGPFWIPHKLGHVKMTGNSLYAILCKAFILVVVLTLNLLRYMTTDKLNSQFILSFCFNRVRQILDAQNLQ